MTESLDGPDDWRRGFHAAMRAFMERYGEAVDINPDAEYAWEEVSSYGWQHTDAQHHIHPYQAQGCRWRLDPDATMATRTYSVFTDTFHESQHEIGLNMGPASCACGAYTGITLRFVGTLGDVLPRLLGIEDTA